MGTIQIDGSTPKLTIGNATAEDALILFDGNAQDYHVGLDDSSDSLVLGLGSSLGTTPAITINSSQVATFAQAPVFPDGSIAVADLDIDGATDVGAAIVDADLFIMDDGAGGTNRKVTASRIKTYAGGAVTAINNATANELVTIGSTTTELDAEAKLLFSSAKLTIGNGTAEDTAIIFDGNETDFYIALDDSANYLRIGTGTTIGSSYGISIDNSTLETAFYGNIKAVGASATLTMGGAVSGQDTKIVFDGNAQDYHIGLDDSSDDLVIGLGSTLGTTTHMAFDETGAITKPLQPCVQVQCGSTQSNTSSPHDIEFDTEIFDQNADFNTTNFTFTSPITGRYLVLISAQLQDITTDPDYFQYNIVTSNRNYNATMDNGVFAATAVYFPLQFQVIADMDASDTLVANLVYESGTTIEVLTQTYLSISLLC